jgi:hypothetical protein
MTDVVDKNKLLQYKEVRCTRQEKSKGAGTADPRSVVGPFFTGVALS